MNNAYISEWFIPTRGLLQGNPAASSSFILIVEILGLNIRCNKKIKGIQIYGMEYKSIQFADDMNLFSECQRESLEEIISTLKEVRINTSLRLNYDKSNVYRIGSARKTIAKMCTLKPSHLSDGPLNILGVMISYDQKEMVKINYHAIIEKIEGILKTWTMRDYMNVLCEVRGLANTNIDNQVGGHIWNSNLSAKDIKIYVRPSSWRVVATHWTEYTFYEPKNKTQILDQYIWLNSNLKVDRKPLHNRSI